ncbi:Leucine aminopeptidase 2 [Diplonema papillatum]|nr:Leucine aminopeptidase 2 [Diplonema papillatum]
MLAAAVVVAASVALSPPHLDGMIDILTEFEHVARENDNSRSIEKGYNASAEYVNHRLSMHNDVFSVVKQYFQVPVWTELEPPTLEISNGNMVIPLHRCDVNTGWQHYEQVCDYRSIRYGGNGTQTVTGNYVFVADPCNLLPTLNGRIAVTTLTSSCTYMDIVSNADKSGAVAVLLASASGPPPGGRIMDSATWNPTVVLPSIPTIGITATLRELILGVTSARIDLAVNQTITLETTYNILATTRLSRTDDTLMIGAHLDSVPAGPGINDNGSGSALILQMAVQLANALRGGMNTLKQTVRFAWWGAEEIGLMGSRYYVDQLVEHYPEELRSIEAYINFDMEAGANYIRMIYDGETAPNPEAVEGSVRITGMFAHAFDSAALSYGLTPLTGGSDFLPFILAGVPAGGLATGAGGVKSQQEQLEHGGYANAPLDPCYHAPCDTVANVNKRCLVECADAFSRVLIEFVADSGPAGVRRRTAVNSTTLAGLYKKHSHGFEMSCDGNDEVDPAARQTSHDREL